MCKIKLTDELMKKSPCTFEEIKNIVEFYYINKYDLEKNNYVWSSKNGQIKLLNIDSIEIEIIMDYEVMSPYTGYIGCQIKETMMSDIRNDSILQISDVYYSSDAIKYVNSLSEFQYSSVKRTSNKDLNHRESLINTCFGIAGESGEVIDHVKKALFHGHALDKNKIKDELGDVMFYIAYMCNTLSIDLTDVLLYNKEKLEKRYKDGFSSSASLNRCE